MDNDFRLFISYIKGNEIDSSQDDELLKEALVDAILKLLEENKALRQKIEKEEFMARLYN